MDKLIAYPSALGQPLRPEDWALIQDVEKELLKALLDGILPGTATFLLSGVTVSGEGTGTVVVSEGYIYTSGEIFYVPTASFTENTSKILFVEQEITTGENRIFKDASTHDVYEYRRYVVGYETVVPEGAIRFSELFTLRALFDQEIASSLSGSANLTGFYNLTYLTGFTKATSYNAIRLEGNSFNGYMLLGAFTATISAGKLTTLPVGMRPTGDLVGFFFNGTVSPGILKIKSNGDIYVSGASTTGTNYITFQFYMRFEDPVLYALPTGGGAPTPDGDSDYLP